MKIIATMIIKNEEKNLPRCLDSIKDFIDEVVVVDTGSTDRSVEIMKSYGAHVFYRPWDNDFSAARNESIKRAIEVAGGDKDFWHFIIEVLFLALSDVNGLGQDCGLPSAMMDDPTCPNCTLIRSKFPRRQQKQYD